MMRFVSQQFSFSLRSVRQFSLAQLLRSSDPNTLIQLHRKSQEARDENTCRYF